MNKKIHKKVNKKKYYTLSLKRGDDTDVNDLQEIDIVGNNPLDKNDEIRVTKEDTHSQSSNAGGIVASDDIVDQDNDQGIVPGEPGHWGVDENTG